jgi:hypothetical protein
MDATNKFAGFVIPLQQPLQVDRVLEFQVGGDRGRSNDTRSFLKMYTATLGLKGLACLDASTPADLNANSPKCIVVDASDVQDGGGIARAPRTWETRRMMLPKGTQKVPLLRDV